MGLELVSPILRAMPGSRWREDVEAVWQYLLANYRILADPLGCSTHVHISLEPFYSISELKRIAQAVIHFEPAFEVFVGSSRRANLFAKSNWLDSSTVAKKDRTRSQLIADIERGASEREIVRLMQERGDRNYSWNFWSLFSSKRTIEFRKPPAGTTSKEVIAWAELAISFIQASVGCRSPQQLQKVPATVGGLRWFISQFTEPGVNDLGRLQILWGSEDPNAALPPVPCRPKRLYTWQVEEREKELERLKRLAAADQRRNQAYAKIAREPYW